MAKRELTWEQQRLALTNRGWYQLFCGNPTCPTRIAGKTHDVHEDELEDGTIWNCVTCRKK